MMFTDKLNKLKSGVHSIEEEITMVNGKWEGYLRHDNVVPGSISIHTEPKLEGIKLTNFYTSYKEDEDWKTHIRVFSNSPKVYINYESEGDQVEAEDINKIQETLTGQVEKLIEEILRSTETDEHLENLKADKTYVDTELLNKHDKDKVFTKEEVLQLIDDLIDGAPEALDTLKELALALDNDPDFAATITNQISKKVDKVTGKSLSDENYSLNEKTKLAGIEEDANKYSHPATHGADIIVENTNKRFVSDIEKERWNEPAIPPEGLTCKQLRGF